MEKVCEICGKPFVVPENFPRTKVCSTECYDKKYFPTKGERRPKKKAGPKEETRTPARPMTVGDVLRWAEQYRQKTGNRLSYGYAVARIEAQGRRKGTHV
ncbi:MAG: hypothetical protein IJO59_06095 [Clostridia bacterium]|nr:hypothetical protein [Clostridia bacterium]